MEIIMLVVIAALVGLEIWAIIVGIVPGVKSARKDYKTSNQEINYFNNLYKNANKGYQDEAWWTTKKRMAAMFIQDWFKNGNKTNKKDGIDLCAIYYYLKNPENATNTITDYISKNLLAIITSAVVAINSLSGLVSKEIQQEIPTDAISVSVLLGAFMISIALVARKKIKASIANENIDKELYISLCEAILKGTTEEKLVKLCSDYFDNPDVVKDTDATSFAAIFKRTKNNHKVEKKNIKK